jgi:hypothetical protein
MQRFDVQPGDIFIMGRETRKRCLIVDTKHRAKDVPINTTQDIFHSRNQAIAADHGGWMLTRSKEGLLSSIHHSESSRAFTLDAA